jgi:MFS family permease
LQVLTSPVFWILSAVFFGFFGTYLTFQGLWVTPYLMSTFGLERMFASGLTMITALGFMLGAPLSGWLADRVFRDRVRVLIWILALQSLLWAALIWGPRFMGIAGVSPLLFMMGALAGGFATALWALVRETTPEQVMGVTTGLLNPAPFAGVAVFQVVTGALLDRVGRTGENYAPEAFADAFLVCLVTVLVCLALCPLLRRYVQAAKA